jgi:predicted transcriptional regulator
MKSTSEINETKPYVELAATIVSSYVSNNDIRPTELPTLIRSVMDALLYSDSEKEETTPAIQKPAVSIRKSITDDYLICLEDGKKFKSLKRHLRAHYNMSPEEYRKKWGLPTDYPMVAPKYAQARSALARSMGLGQQMSKKH